MNHHRGGITAVSLSCSVNKLHTAVTWLKAARACSEAAAAEISLTTREGPYMHDSPDVLLNTPIYSEIEI